MEDELLDAGASDANDQEGLGPPDSPVTDVDPPAFEDPPEDPGLGSYDIDTVPADDHVVTPAGEVQPPLPDGAGGEGNQSVIGGPIDIQLPADGGVGEPPTAPEGAIVLDSPGVSPAGEVIPPTVVDPNAPQDQDVTGAPPIELPTDGADGTGIQEVDQVPDTRVELPPLDLIGDSEGEGDQSVIGTGQPGGPGDGDTPERLAEGLTQAELEAEIEQQLGHVFHELAESPGVDDHYGQLTPEQRDAVIATTAALAADGTIDRKDFDAIMETAGMRLQIVDASGHELAGLGVDVSPTVVTDIPGEGQVALRATPGTNGQLDLCSITTETVYTAEPAELSRQWAAAGHSAFIVTPIEAPAELAAAAAPAEQGGSGLAGKLALGGAVLLPIAGLGTYLATRKRQ